MIDWKPISEARTQETYLVGNEDYRGWFAVASMNALHEWHLDGGLYPLPYTPTHFAHLTPIVEMLN